FSASGVITLSMAALIKRGTCTLTIVLTSMQLTLTRKSGQFLEIYRQIRVKVPIRATIFLYVTTCNHRVSLIFHLLRIFGLSDGWIRIV
ncbi:hypothetical protein KAU92_05920, partial [Candidatus Bathyarchaeota archaeon]|nr:hypothetical protein [Candidatus Bathyarchaeota archaeon]